ncbi:ABC transporter permease [Streptomyces sp. NPDC006235]|uniref:ABC transporter permease n=1 Tax=Streptomyces sp. NPDC006235 TaxID=3156736 RepID=UPI0033B58CFF
MTAVTVHTPTSAERFPRPHGLVLAVLRLHRSALWFWLMLVTVAAGTLLWATFPGADAAWAEYTGMGCDRPSPNLGCDDPGPANVRYQTAVTFGTGVLGILPLLTGAWAGSALIGRELENGTAQLAWTQSVTPARWLAAKLAVPALLLTVGTLALTLLHRVLWSSNSTLLGAMDWREWHDNGAFQANGTVATAQALAALAVGVLAGLLLRRTLAALGVAVLAAASLVYVLDDLRPHLWPTQTVTAAPGRFLGSDGMVVEDGALTATGARVPFPACMGDPGCANGTGITGYYADYHPASHFWPLQLVETGILLAVAALAAGAAFALLARRLP